MELRLTSSCTCLHAAVLHLCIDERVADALASCHAEWRSYAFLRTQPARLTRSISEQLWTYAHNWVCTQQSAHVKIDACSGGLIAVVAEMLTNSWSAVEMDIIARLFKAIKRRRRCGYWNVGY